MDNALFYIAKKGKCYYSRYADDITFSTNRKIFSSAIANIEKDKVELGDELINIIRSNTFKVNETKVRFGYRHNRQEVTGLKVNEFLNVDRKFIRQIRAMLHAWEVHKIEKAAEEHFSKYSLRRNGPANPTSTFEKIVTGKIGFVGMVRGKNNAIYIELYKRIKKLNPDVKLPKIAIEALPKSGIVVFGEGKSDWKHLKAAYKHFLELGKFSELNISFKEYEDAESVNNTTLLETCKQTARIKHEQIIICIFDRDVSAIVKQIKDGDKDYKAWGNNTFSLLLPIPGHRDFDSICIEHFYLDDDLIKKDDRGRRLFLSTEFDKGSCRHKTENLNCIKSNEIRRNYPSIIDDKVFDTNNTNIALPKDDFANNVLNRIGVHNEMNFDSFEEIFNIIKDIEASTMKKEKLGD